MKPLLILAATLLTAACVTPAAPPPGAPSTSVVTLTAEPPSNGVVILILQNGHREPVGYNLCNSSLQRRSGSSWQPVETGEICTMELRGLPPGQDATFQKRLPADLAAGEYRYVTSVEIPMGGEYTALATDPFTVR